MPKEKGSVFAMLRGDEPGLLARFWHDLSGAGEGAWGEKCLAALLKNRADKAVIFQNVYVPSTDGTAELDIVLIGGTGLYIFESKAYGGQIYGRPEQLNWVQQLGGGRNLFYNPVRQNENHRRKLAKALKIAPENILSFIVFENRADLSNVYPTKDNSFVVCNRRKLIKNLVKIIDTRNLVFTLAEIEQICQKLTVWSDAGRRTKKRHIKQVQQQTHGDTCPFCGCQLVIRQGKYGSFIGCSAYPRCKYVRKMD